MTDVRPAVLVEAPAPVEPQGDRRLLDRVGTAWPASFVLALYLVTTGRQGSYVRVPGLPVFISDIALAIGVVTLVLRRRREARAGIALMDVPMLLLVAYVAYAALRLAAGGVPSETALRDAAPYLYGVIALLAFSLPALANRASRPVVYGMLLLHALWAVVPRYLGWPWGLPDVGGEPLLSPRPDFEATIMGAAVAFAVYDLLHLRVARRPLRLIALLAFIALNDFGVARMTTRAGLLASLASLLAVLVAWAKPFGRTGRDGRRRTLLVGVVSVFVLIGVSFTAPGERLRESLVGAPGNPTGTMEARYSVWKGVGSFVLEEPGRTAAGVGFGPDFLAESGTLDSLAGTEYSAVRSPHNYLVGTLARLGVAGALLALLILTLGIATGFRALASSHATAREAPTVLAAVLVIGLPVAALLGVILEAPFGALVWFWCFGQVCRWRVESQRLQEIEAVEQAGELGPLPPEPVQ